jgi:hypothetical protein
LRLAPQPQDPPAEEEGNDDPQYRHRQRRPAHLHQLRGLHFQTHAEQQEHHAEIRQGREQFVGPDQVQHRGSDENPGQDFSDDGGLAQALEDFGQ